MVQILLDLLALSIIIYFTGGIESPIFLFFIFHVVIGSILLPAFIIYPLGFLLGGTLLLVSILELYSIIPHHNLLKITGVTFYNIPEIVYGINLFFIIVILLTIFITKKLANEIFDKELELSSAVADKQKFIVAIVHELKSPIAAASSLIDLVLNGYAGTIDDTAKEKIGKSKFRLDESISNINNILEVSKYKLSHEINRAQLTITELLKPIIENSSTIADSKKISLKYPDFTEGHFSVEGDKVLLSLVFSNVIGNAVKYTPENGIVKIEVSKERDNYLVSVHDSGIGIPKNELNKVFEDNFRSSNARDRKIEGTGTGLSLAKEIMKSHEGAIRAESPSGIGSEENPGSVFHITLKAKTHSEQE